MNINAPVVFIYFTLLTLTQKEDKRRVAVKETTQILNTSRVQTELTCCTTGIIEKYRKCEKV